MRALAAIAALGFAYLALIPAALVGSTLDPGCSSGGGYGPPLTAYLTVAFGASALALLAAAASLVAFAVRPSPRIGVLCRRALAASAAAIGVLLYSEFALAYPIVAVVIAVISASAGALITRGRPPGAGTRRAPG